MYYWIVLSVFADPMVYNILIEKGFKIKWKGGGSSARWALDLMNPMVGLSGH